MKKNKKAFSLVVAMWLVLITSLLAYTILEYMIPFSRNVRWIENSTSAYYAWNKWVEVWLYFLNQRSDNELKISTTKNYLANNQYDFKINTSVAGPRIPEAWKWNSYFDTSRNQILVWNPIQLSVWYNYLPSKDLKINFRVPDLNNNWLKGSSDNINNENITHSDWLSTWIVNWQLSSTIDTLNSHSGSLVTFWDVNNDSQIDVFWLEWKRLNWTTQSFENFYATNCSWIWKECMLKFSVINKLETPTGSWVPYLEWVINSWNVIPLRYSRIVSEWKSYWFIKQIEVRIPQETVSEAFDFTVFQ